jgi:gliding motility-associated-like protein
LTHTWKFSDGTTQQTLNATKSFSPVGSYTAELVTQSAFGCKDSTRTTVWVLPNGVPAFEWDTVCLDRPVLFRNNSNENSSVFVQYNWDFGDGGTGSTIKNPPPVTYSTTGWKDVTLTITTLGCENDPVSLTRSLKVNRPDDGIRYRTITVPEGTTRWIHVRDTIGRIYNWRPPIQLTSYTTAYTEFIATASGVDVEYLIDITDENTCITTDTVFMQILKKPGFYLPTAFTPNDDGLNDVVKPYIIGMKAFKSFSVFNRWGNLIFRSSTYGEGWDGKYKGVTQDPGVYVWILEFVDSNDKKVTEKGNLTIIR